MNEKHFCEDIQKVVNRLKSKGDKNIQKVRTDLIALKQDVAAQKIDGASKKAHAIYEEFLGCQKKANHRVIRDKLNSLYLRLQDYKPAK